MHRFAYVEQFSRAGRSLASGTCATQRVEHSEIPTYSEEAELWNEVVASARRAVDPIVLRNAGLSGCLLVATTCRGKDIA